MQILKFDAYLRGHFHVFHMASAIKAQLKKKSFFWRESVQHDIIMYNISNVLNKTDMKPKYYLLLRSLNKIVYRTTPNISIEAHTHMLIHIVKLFFYWCNIYWCTVKIILVNRHILLIMKYCSVKDKIRDLDYQYVKLVTVINDLYGIINFVLVPPTIF